jgi:hypothetical protein
VEMSGKTGQSLPYSCNVLIASPLTSIIFGPVRPFPLSRNA